MLLPTIGECCVDRRAVRTWLQRMRCTRHTLPHWRRSSFAFAKRTLPVCGMLATRDPPIGQQLTLKELDDDALGTSRPPRCGHRATRIESEVGMEVGHGMYYRVTPVYIQKSRWSGAPAGRSMRSALPWTKSRRPSTEGQILQNNSKNRPESGSKA